MKVKKSTDKDLFSNRSVIRGFTLIELMVAMSLSSVIFILVGSFMAFVVEKNSKNQRSELFEQTKNDLARDLTNSVKWAKEISIADNKLTADSIIYVFAGGKIMKNGQSLVSDSVTINSFEIKNYGLDTESVSLQISMDMHSVAYPLSKDKLRLVISQRMTEVKSE